MAVEDQTSLAGAYFGDQIRSLLGFSDHADRNLRRRQAITVLLRRLSSPPDDLDDKADLLTVMTSFESYETLAASGRDADAAARLINAAARRLLA